jgi:hypothetical protein
VPVFTDQQSYSNATGLQTYGGAPLPTWNIQGQLANNGQSYNNCFAIMTLTGPSVTVDYYQVPLLGTASRLPVDDKMQPFAQRLVPHIRGPHRDVPRIWPTADTPHRRYSRQNCSFD